VTQPEPEYHQPTNGAHTRTTLPDGWQDPAALMWSLWTEPERLDRIMDNPVTEEWYQRTPCDYLATLAYFRPVPAEWGRIWERFKSLGGKPTLLEAAIQSLLSDPQTARASPTGEEPRSAPAPLAASKVSSRDLLALTVPPSAPYLDWLDKRAVVMLYGPRGVGKTYVLLELAVCLAMPRTFLKWPVYRQAPVLFVDGEMALVSLQKRLRDLAGDHPPPGLHFLPSHLVYTRSGRDLTLTAPADRLAIDAMLEEDAIKILVLDNISCLFPGLDESKKSDWEAVNAWFIRLSHRGITTVVGHHAGKNGQQRGTSSREDNIDMVIALTLPPGHQAEDGCHVHLRFEKTRGVKGKAVEALDVRLEDSPHGQVWTQAPLDVRSKERITAMLDDGMPAKLIADELGLSPSYVYRCKREVGG
jgi:hypothetical protein